MEKELDKDEVIKLYTQLKSVNKVAKILKVPVLKMFKYFDDHNIKYVRRHFLDKSLTIKDFEEVYKKLGTLEKVAEHFNVSLEKIRKTFIKYNIDYVKRTKYICNHDFFSEDTEQAYYWAGFIAADGNIDKNSTLVRIILCSKDKDHLIKFRNDVGSDSLVEDFETINNNFERYKRGVYYSSRIYINSGKMQKDLANFNIVPNKSLTYKFPHHLSNNDNIKHFIRGMIDGDGWVNHTSNHGNIGLCGTYDCVNYIKNFLISKLSLIGGEVTKHGTIWKFVFYNIYDLQKIVSYLYDDATVWLDRKYYKAMAIKNSTPKLPTITKESMQDALIGNTLNKEDTIKYLCNKFKLARRTIQNRITEFKLRGLIPTS